MHFCIGMLEKMVNNFHTFTLLQVNSLRLQDTEGSNPQKKQCDDMTSVRLISNIH